MKKTICSIMVVCSLIISAKAFSEEINIKKLEDAQVFASFIDGLPAVLNYFTKANEQQIIDFYISHYGEIKSQELKRKRLTLTFQSNDQNIRVVISKQNNQQQVDVIVTK